MSSTLKESRIGCVCVGRGGGDSITNVRMGGYAMDITTAPSTKNVVIGCCAARCAQDSFTENVVIGYRAGWGCTSGDQSVVIGCCAAAKIPMSATVAIGTKSNFDNGNYAQKSVAIGEYAAYSTDGFRCSVAIGTHAARYGAHAYSVVIGCGAGCYNVDGNNQVLIGTNAGNSNGYGKNVTLIGCGSFGTSHCATVVGNDARGGFMSVAIGHNSTAGDCRVAIGYNATTVPEGLDVWGNSGNNVYNCIWPNWTFLSDCRDKWDVQPLNSNYGIPLLKKLRPVSFRWDHRQTYVREKGMEFGQKDGSFVSEHKEYGFIAQEVKQSTDELNIKLPGIEEESERYSLVYTDFLYTSIESIKQIIERIENLEDELNLLENQ